MESIGKYTINASRDIFQFKGLEGPPMEKRIVSPTLLLPIESKQAILRFPSNDSTGISPSISDRHSQSCASIFSPLGEDGELHTGPSRSQSIRWADNVESMKIIRVGNMGNSVSIRAEDDTATTQCAGTLIDRLISTRSPVDAIYFYPTMQV